MTTPTSAEVEKMLDLLKRAKTYVEFDAQMMADLTRFAPLAPDQQSQHDSTEYDSEKWLKEYEEFMICFEKARQ